MLNKLKKTFHKSIIFFIVCCLILTNLSVVLIFQAKEAKAVEPVAETVGPPLTTMFFSIDAARAQLVDVVWPELKKIFYKTIIGTFANTAAQQAAVWVAGGGQGGGPLWIEDRDAWIQDYTDAAIGDIIYNTVNKITGLNVCTLDPAISLQLALNIPFFDVGVNAFQPECSFTELQDHWEEVGKKDLEDYYSIDIGLAVGGEFPEGIRQTGLNLQGETSLRDWQDPTLTSYVIGGCTPHGVGRCQATNDPPIQTNLIRQADTLDRYIGYLRDDVKKMIEHANKPGSAILSPQAGGATPVIYETIDTIRQNWLTSLRDGQSQIKELETRYRNCGNVGIIELVRRNDCNQILTDLNLTKPSIADISPTGSADERQAALDLALVFDIELKRKITLVLTFIDTINSGYERLITDINVKLKPEKFRSAVPWDSDLAKGLANPSANPWSAYDTLARESINAGFDTWINQSLELVVDQGWKSVTDTVGDYIRTPSDSIRAWTNKQFTQESNLWYTGDILADATGVFLQTLWNELMRRLLEALNPPQSVKAPRAPQLQPGDGTILPTYDQYNPYEEEAYSPEGLQYYVEKLAEKFQVNFSFRDVDLLSDFQLNLQGNINPNLYNNVIDTNFALAISDQLTIADAMNQNKLVGTFTFSWGEELVPGTYHLANIKKLRKARVVPLGLELAAELIRDCNYRATLDEINNQTGELIPDGVPDYADFNDLAVPYCVDDPTDPEYDPACVASAGPTQPRYPFGYDSPAEPYKSQRLKNCLFRPWTEQEVNKVTELREYNKRMMGLVVNATLADVVNGYNQVGEGSCGDFDNAESPFCNLVNPNWVLKLPVTRCSMQTDAEPYSELLVTNTTGQRYSRCPDFASCLTEDGQGKCLDEEFGFCVKEKNSWQFGANLCPSQYSSCRSYNVDTPSGQQQVSYLKNTLSGNEICGPENAGCQWYATSQNQALIWQDSARLYLNRYTETCDKQNEGCSKFYIYRDSNNNLVADSSFEYTADNNFPEAWDLRLKETVANQTECPAPNFYYETCTKYNYALLIPSGELTELEARDRCLANGGTWTGSCSDSSYTTQTTCQSGGETWTPECDGAINDDVSPALCNAAGQLVSYCIKPVLRYDLCLNPKFDDQNLCLGSGGSWQEICEKDGQLDSQFADETECNDNNGTWLRFCDNAMVYDSTKAACDDLSGQWQGHGPFSPYGFVSKDGINARDGISKLQLDISTLTEDQQLQLIYRSQYADPYKKLIRGGDIYTATAYLKADVNLSQPVAFNLLNTSSLNDVSSNNLAVVNFYNRVSSTIIVGPDGGTGLAMQINLPGGECQRQGGVLFQSCYLNGQIYSTDSFGNPVLEPACSAAQGSWQYFCQQSGQDYPINIYFDTLQLSLNSLSQIQSRNFVSTYSPYITNTDFYAKSASDYLNCHGYGLGDPPPILNYQTPATCEAKPPNGPGGFWDLPLAQSVFDKTRLEPVCYKYPPDDSNCANYMKVCQPEEVGCQIYTPVNDDPPIPGVVSSVDLCPSECVGYDTYKQEPVLYEPEPDPLYNYFIPATAQSCSLSEVGCAEFTNLGRKVGASDGASTGLEKIEYYTFLRQCISPTDELPQKTYFTWQGSASGPPQIIKYELEADLVSGAPATIDKTTDCRIDLGEDDFNCLKLYDNDGNIYYRDIRKTIVVSDQCITFRKTEATESNCTSTNGRWQAVTESCLYDGVPSLSNVCGAEANGCRAFVGNQGNNVFVKLFNNFENSSVLDWYVGQSGFDTGNLEISGESVNIGGHSLRVPDINSSIHKFVDIYPGNLYTLSFWAKTEDTTDKLKISFDTAVNDNDNTTLEEFASLSKCSDIAYNDQTSCEAAGGIWQANKIVLELTNEWQKFDLGPVFINDQWQALANNSLVITDINSNIYLDNITLRVVKDNIYVIKDTWVTPQSCDLNFYGGYEKGAMLGCQAYTDTLNQIHFLKSFTSLCRESVVGCQVLIDTQNSLNPNSQLYNDNNLYTEDDYTVPADKLTTLVINEKYQCSDLDKGCQKLGKPNYGQTDGLTVYDDVYLKNNPDQYINVPNAILCNHDALGCTELINQAGGSEFYKIEPTKLCTYSLNVVNGNQVEGWFKKGSTTYGCGSLVYNRADCLTHGGYWSEKYNQCALVLTDIIDEEICTLRNDEWLVDQEICLASPFNIYKVYEANKYKGYVGECASQYHGCTELVDINPNYIANGDIEFVDQAGRPTYWAVKNATSGSYNLENSDVQLGEQAIKLIKRTSQACPETSLYANASCSLGTCSTGQTTYTACQASSGVWSDAVPTYALSQDVVELERGKTYKVSFYYKVPLDAAGRGTNCELPEASFSLTPKTREGDPLPGFATREFVLSPETEWKKVEVLFQVSQTDQESYDLEMRIYAPRNLNQQASLATGQNTGNCLDSYILYDLLEIKDNTEDSYYVLDAGANLDRSSCTSINWDNGCVEFYNTFNSRSEIVKVKRDRNCQEWAVCSSHCWPETQHKTESACLAANSGKAADQLNVWDVNICTATDICLEEKSGQCVKFAAKDDNVRYDLAGEPLIVKRITDYQQKEGYIYRFGAGQKTRLVEWRAGDYSGYTIPERIPVEAELEFSQPFDFYPQENDIGENADPIYTDPVCKVYPAEDAPLPYQLSQDPNYKNLINLYSPSETLANIGNGCFYEKATASGAFTYFSLGSVGQAKQIYGICTSPEEIKGQGCGEDAQCKYSVTPITGEANPREGTCADIDSVKQFSGLEGMCLELDTTKALYSNVYGQAYSVSTGFDYQPYACLTYYPFLIDICPLHGKDSVGCSLNPQCTSSQVLNACVRQ